MLSSIIYPDVAVVVLDVAYSPPLQVIVVSSFVVPVPVDVYQYGVYGYVILTGCAETSKHKKISLHFLIILYHKMKRKSNFIGLVCQEEH